MKHYDPMTARFLADYGEEVAEQITEAAWRGERECGRVQIVDTTMLNAANHVVTACIDDDEVVVVEMGDRNGFLVLAYGDDAVGFNHPRPYRFILVPAKELPPELVQVYEAWKKQPWFAELQGKINYDFMFSPTEKIRKHYEALAAAKGLKIEREKS